MKYLRTVFIFFLLLIAFLSYALAEDKPVQEIAVIGEFFGQPVPAQNYFFIKSLLSSFADRLWINPQDPEELEDYTWDYLLLSYEAFQNNIVATAAEINAEIKDILKGSHVSFNRDKDKDAYARWVKEKTGQSPAVFENQARFIVEVNKLRQRIIDGFPLRVSEEEIRQQFEDKENAISLEVAGFLKREDAQGFYEKVRETPGFWEEEKTKRPDSFKRYELVALSLLSNELSLERQTLYKMLVLGNNEIYPPLGITRGYGVFKILNKKLASQLDYDKLKDKYIVELKDKKKNQGFQEWFTMVKQKARIKIYRKGG